MATADPEFAAQMKASHREAVRRFRKVVEADPQRLAAYRAQRRQWHYDRTPEQRAARKSWYSSLSNELKQLFLLDLRKKRAFDRLRTITEFCGAAMTYEWKEEYNALLGTMADTALAAQIGCTPAVVSYRRKTFGIPAYVASDEWDEKNTPLLGTVSDVDLASRLGLQASAVRYQREKRGIDKATSARSEWTQDEDSLLGTMGDVDVAKRIGRTAAAVRLRRISLGIPTVRRRQNAVVMSGRVEITPAMQEKLNALEPLLVQRYLDAGLPIARLESWQIVEIALGETLANALKDAARRKSR